MWTQALAFGVGVSLMAAPALVPTGEAGANFLRIIGPVAGSIGFIAMAEVTRGLRWANLLSAAALLLAPLPLGMGAGGVTVSWLAAAILTASVLLASGTPRRRFGGGWRALLE